MKKAFLWGLCFIASSLLAQSNLPFGVNLAGAEFGHGSKMPGEVNKDYFYPTTDDLDYWATKQLRLLRVPFKWERIQHDPFSSLTKEEVDVMKQMLQDADKRGLKVILDLHNYGRRRVGDSTYILGAPELPLEALSDFWKRLVTELQEYKHCIYGYGLMNEPHDMLEHTPWVKIAQACIIEIRKVDMTTSIIVGGNHWSSAERWLQVSDELKYLYDPAGNLIFEAHCYFDNDASGVYRGSYDEEKAHPYVGVERLSPFIKWLKANNFRGFVGEYGIPATDERWSVCLENMLDYMQKNGVNGTYWAAGARWNNYILSTHPQNNYTVDMPQISILTKYLVTK